MSKWDNLTKGTDSMGAMRRSYRNGYEAACKDILKINEDMGQSDQDVLDEIVALAKNFLDDVKAEAENGH